MHTQPEVGYLDGGVVIAVVEEDVLWLQVPVHYVVEVHVLHRPEDAPQDDSTVSLRESLSGHQLLESTPVGHLHHYVDTLTRFEYFSETDDVLLPEGLEYLGLHHEFLVVLLLDSVFLDDLDGLGALGRGGAMGQHDSAERPLAQQPGESQAVSRQDLLF